MPFVNIFTSASPTIAGLTFDAILEDSLDISVEWTNYPVESGVRVTDHRIIQPIRWVMTGVVSNMPLKAELTDFIGGGLSNLRSDNSLIAGAAGLSAGFLAGDASSRASTALDELIKIMQAGEPFNVDAGDIQLVNMVISRIGRTKDPDNELALVFVAEMQELITLDRLPNIGQPQQDQLPDGDVSKTGAAADFNKGQVNTSTPNPDTSKEVNAVLNG